MSDTTELKRDKLSEWFRQQIEPLLDHEYERGKADALSTQPASEPSAITAEDVKRWFQLLVGMSEEAMHEDIRATLKGIPAEPSEPVAEDAEVIAAVAKALHHELWIGAELGIGNSSLRDFKEEDHFVMNLTEWLTKATGLVEYVARHASARAVEAERQRLARLLVDEHRAIDELLKSTVLSKSELDCVPTKRAALQKFKSWLAGEGDKS